MTGSHPLRTQEDVAQHLRARIIRAEYPPGSKLPPERRLADELGVKRLVVRGAIASLATDGLVRTHPGSCVEVLDWRDRGAPGLVHWILAHAEADGKPCAVYSLFREVIRVRRALAIDVLLCAAANATEDDVRGLEEVARRQAQLFDKPRDYLAGDEEYQRRVLRIAQRPIVELLFNGLCHVVGRRPDAILAFLGPLRQHHESYGLVHGLLRESDAAKRGALAERVLDLVEANGLSRVRRHLGADEEGPAPDAGALISAPHSALRSAPASDPHSNDRLVPERSELDRGARARRQTPFE